MNVAAELPEISSSTYRSHAIEGPTGPTGPAGPIGPIGRAMDGRRSLEMQIAELTQWDEKHLYQPSNPMPTPTRRLVQIFIADPHPDVPLDNCLLHQSEKPFLTDLDDQELFFEIPIQQLLHDHNTYRVTLPDKEASRRFGKEVMLEPIKIRALKMVVLTIASF